MSETVYLRLSKKWSPLLFLFPLFLAALLFLGVTVNKEKILHFYLYRLNLLPSVESPLHIPVPEVIPRSGPTEKILGRILLLFSWDLDGTLEHPTLGTLPFHLSLERNKGDISISTKNGGLKANWRGKKRWIKFDHTPLSLLSTLPEGEIQGEWADDKGHKGSVLVTLKGGETISFRGEGKKVLINSTGLKLEGDLDLDLTIGKPPTLTLENGSGRLGTKWWLKEMHFDSSIGKIEGELVQEEPLQILSGLEVKDGFGHFAFDINEKKLVGTDFEASITLLNEQKKALFPYWEADREGGAFEAWIEKEGLIKGIYTQQEIHLFEGSYLGGIEMGPLKVGKEKIEGTIRSELAPMLEKWSQWSLFPMPALPSLEGKLEGEILLTETSGECHLSGKNLRIGEWPITSAFFHIELGPQSFRLKEGALEEFLFSFDLIRKGPYWEMPSIAFIWRDFFRGTATGMKTKEGAHFLFNHLSADLTLLEALPQMQEFLHRFDLKGLLKGNGEIFYSNDAWTGHFKIKGEEWMLGEKAFPFFQEMSLDIGDRVLISGGSFQLDNHLITLQEGVFDEDGFSCKGEGLFCFPWCQDKAVSCPWQYKEGLFSGTVDLESHGLFNWEKGSITPLSIQNTQRKIACEIEENGAVKGTWGPFVTFEMMLEGEGKGEGRARFLGLPLPKVPIESPLPLEIGWIYPSIGTLPFKLAENGLQILPGGEIYSEGKGIRYEKVEGLIGWNGELELRLLPKASRLPLYWLERGEITILGTMEEPKVEVKWR